MSRAKGNLAEAKALQHLVQNGFEIVDQNVYSRFGEIDIIAKKNGVLHFIEVKSSLDYESAIYNITSKKLQRVIKTAQVYLKKNGIASEYVFDAVIVTPHQIEIVENLTM